jgi:acyl-coenzyme A thioesterase PaaI-like protein
MEGEFVSLDLDNQTLVAKFPVYKKYLNPYRTMQGGIIAAAVDNTLGPLSMLVSPPNVTRRLEMKYSHPVTLDYNYITVLARLIDHVERWLTFSAEVRTPESKLIAKARAIHWIVDDEVNDEKPKKPLSKGYNTNSV